MTPTDNRLVHVFTGLDPKKRYGFRGSAVRGGASYTYRWTLCRLDGAVSFRNAHSSNVLTSASTDIPACTLATNQVAFNCGINNTSSTGDIVDWEDIVPSANGTIAVYSFRYTNSIPSRYGVPGNYATNNTHTYAVAGIRLEEFSAAPVTLASQPQSVETCSGHPASFSVSVTGLLPIRFQWRRDGIDIVGTTNQTLTIPSVVPADASTNYTVVCTNSINSVTSAPASLVLAAALIITSQPQNATSRYGEPATFVSFVSTNASQPVSYQWYKNFFPENLTGIPISGANGTQFTIPVVKPTNEAYYYLVASNCSGLATSQVASLKVTYAPVVIASQPQNAQAVPGSTASFTVSATGDLVVYQWYKNNAAIPGATNATLTLSNLALTDSGLYHVVAANPSPSLVSSSNAALLVAVPAYVLVPFTNRWKYNQAGTDLGTAWKDLNYDDSGWPTGRGVFAYEANNAVVQALTNTALWLTNPAANHIITYYFRTTFNLTNDPGLVTLTTSNLIDDGCVVFLNGVEACRIRLNSDVPVGYDTLAANATEGVFDVTNLPSTLLVPGTNVLAVEVHQTSPTSVDVVFGLSARVDPLIPTSSPQITSQPQSVAGEEQKPATFTVGYVGDALRFQWYKWNPNTGMADPISHADQRTLTITNPIFGVDDGSYFVVLTNFLGTAISSNAVLTVLRDTNPPVLLEADGTANWNTVVLAFNEPLLLFEAGNPSASPTNLDNFTITNTFGESLAVPRRCLPTEPTSSSPPRRHDVKEPTTLPPSGAWRTSPRSTTQPSTWPFLFPLGCRWLISWITTGSRSPRRDWTRLTSSPTAPGGCRSSIPAFREQLGSSPVGRPFGWALSARLRCPVARSCPSASSRRITASLSISPPVQRGSGPVGSSS